MMLGGVVVGVAVLALLGWGVVAALRAVARRRRVREFEQSLSEEERLEAVRAYTSWVRYPPEPPPRHAPLPPEVPSPVVPPVGGRRVPFPGRRMAGG